MHMCEPFHSPRTIGLSSVQPDEVPAESPSGRTTKLSRRRAFGVAAAVVAAPSVARLGWTQGYPSRPLRVIVPVAAGGANDTTARLFAQKLSESLGQQFYVEKSARRRRQSRHC